MQWRTKRKLIYTVIALAPLVIIAAIIYASTFFPDPTCFDGIQNQNEERVDCGGLCERVCQDPLADIDVVWSRSFLVSDSIYNSVAYIENPNSDLIAKDVPYKFRIYDKDNILITERRGVTDLFSQSKTAIFISGIDTKNRMVGRTVFEFLEPPYWEESLYTDVQFGIENRDLDLSSDPELSLDVINKNTRSFRDVVLVAFIYNNSGEAVHVSQTVVDNLDLQESESVIFTWREKFPGDDDSYQTEVIPTSYEFSQ
jgi:hypothetical protein